MSDNDNAVVIERKFDAPSSLVWQMWTVPEHFAAWYGPQGATIPVAKIDLTVGGQRHICMQMQTPNGEMKMWFVGEHLEINENTKLAYTESMSDEDGNVKSAADMGMPEGHPSSTEVHVEIAESDGSTVMTMTHVGVPADSPGAMGWNMAFDKLETYVAAQ